MCGRFYVPEDSEVAMLRKVMENLESRNVTVKTGEVSPGDVAAVIASNRELKPQPFGMLWGYHLPNGKLLFNARSETAAQKAIFADGMEHRRCAIPAAHYSTTNRDGYREYKSDPKKCTNCPTRELCTHSKDCVKTVQRHIWKDYEELADDARYTPACQELYRKRKETVERVFADAKEKHAMRYTQYRGLTQVTNWVKLKFAAMNLKKLATWRWNDQHHLLIFHTFFCEYAKNPVAA